MKVSKKHSLFSVCMAILLLVSSTGFSIDMHFCQGNLKSFRFFGKAESCHEMVQAKTCQSLSAHQVKPCKKNCCSNRTFDFSAQDSEFQLNPSTLSVSQQQFITAFVSSFLLPEVESYKQNIPHLNYIPPLLIMDIPVLIQSFLL